MFAKTYSPPRAQALAKVSATELIPLPCGPPIAHARLFSSVSSHTFDDLAWFLGY
jgi:hypothetical protein